MDVETSRFCRELGLLNGRHFDGRKMLSYVCLLPMPLAFHCSMFNVLSDMVDVWAGLGGVEGARGCGGVLQAVHTQPLAL